MTAKNKIRDIVIITNGVFWTSYLINSFLMWNFTNPWQWVIDLQKDIKLRYFTILILFIWIIFFLIYTTVIDEWRVESNHTKRILIILFLSIFITFISK